MRIVYIGQEHVEGLRHLIARGLDDIVAVVASEGPLVDMALRYGIPIMTDDEPCVLEDIDLVVSYGFPRRIKKSLIELPKIGCINFHPAPLPDFRGMGGVYNFAIYEGLRKWGVSAHFVDGSFDTGDIIKVVRFPIGQETVLSLKQKSHAALIMLFIEVMDIVREGSTLPRTPQGEGRYISRRDFEELRRIEPNDSLEEIDRKVRAFWCPPHNGAYVKLHGKEYTLINEETLRELK